MSLINFLASVFSRLYYIFSSVYHVIQWLVSSAYPTLYQYVYTYFSPVHNLSTQHYAGIQQYDYYVKPNAVNILVNNVGRTNALVFSYFDVIADYANNVRYRINDIVVNFYQKMLYLFNTGWGIVNLLLSYQSTMYTYLFGGGKDALIDYDSNIQASAHRLKEVEPQLKEHVRSDRHYNLLDFADRLYSKVVTLSITQFPIIGKLVESASKVFTLVNTNIFPKLQEVFSTEYTGLRGLLDIADNIIEWFNGDMQQTGEVLDQDTRNFLVELLNNPAQFILDVIKVQLLAVVGRLIFDWLYQPYEE